MKNQLLLRKICPFKKSAARIINYFIDGSVLFFCCIATQAGAIDLQPGELGAPKPGFNSLLLIYQQSERGDRYLNGVRQAGNPSLSTTQTSLRVGRSFELANQPAYTYVQTGLGDIQTGGSLAAIKGDSGMLDTTFALAVWPYSNPVTKTHFGIGAFLTTPTGSYSRDRSFNLGANRYNAALQAGVQTPLSEQLTWAVAIDSVWFGKNTDFTAARAELEQQALYTAQTSLQYEFNPSYNISGSYFYVTGGESSVNGLRRNDVIRTQRYVLTGTANFAYGRFTLQYGGDLKTANSYIENSRWALRYITRF